MYFVFIFDKSSSIVIKYKQIKEKILQINFHEHILCAPISQSGPVEDCMCHGSCHMKWAGREIRTWHGKVKIAITQILGFAVIEKARAVTCDFTCKFIGKLQQESNEVQLLQIFKFFTYLVWIGIKGEAAFIQLHI